jgi:hypothetical protein
MQVLAASDDNSLSSLNIHNGKLERDFEYDIWEYNVTVDPGTTELLLEPTTSDANASITSITGTVLEDGEATVLINTLSESGIPMTYTLHVKESGEAVAETEPETEVPETEVQTEQETEIVTEALQETETEPATATNVLQDKVAQLKEDADMMMMLVYGLIGLSVILLFIIIHMILRNKDLKDDLKDAENQLAYQANENARKERMMVSEESFGNRAAATGYHGMQPEDVPPNLPITEDPAVKEQQVRADEQAARIQAEAAAQAAREQEEAALAAAQMQAQADAQMEAAKEAARQAEEAAAQAAKLQEAAAAQAQAAYEARKQAASQAQAAGQPVPASVQAPDSIQPQTGAGQPGTEAGKDVDVTMVEL